MRVMRGLLALTAWSDLLGACLFGDKRAASSGVPAIP